MPAQTIPAAPSAAPTPVQAPAAGTVAPAPVAAVTAPSTLNDFVELARQHIAGELTPTPVSAPPVTGQEPSPEPAASAPAEPSQVDSPAEPAGDEPAAEDMANWSEGEKKLHGALVKERAERKEARAETRELKAKLAELEAKLNANPAPSAERPEPTAPTPPVPSTSSVLGDCNTFESVDARAVQAAATESQAVRLQNMLNRNGVEAVAEKLVASGVTTIGNLPVAEASAEQIGEFLASVYEGARLVQANASPRKAWITQNQSALVEAVKILPELRDQNSPAFKAVATLIHNNPDFRNRADWPVIAAQQYLGQMAWNAKLTPAPPVPAATPRPAAKPAPGASRNSAAALPQPNAGAELARKIADGTATLNEVQEYTRGKISVA